MVLKNKNILGSQVSDTFGERDRRKRGDVQSKMQTERNKVSELMFVNGRRLPMLSYTYSYTEQRSRVRRLESKC